MSGSNSSMPSMEDEQAILLSAFVQDFGMGAEKKLQQDMVAYYLQCGAQEGVKGKCFNLLLMLNSSRVNSHF